MMHIPFAEALWECDEIKGGQGGGWTVWVIIVHLDVHVLLRAGA